jgi:uncharacterized membrane protein YphA (DoxX/SURF4 family)
LWCSEDCCFATIFLMSGLAHLSIRSATPPPKGVPLASLAVLFSGVLALAGGLSILLDYRAQLGGAWLIILFLVPVTLDAQVLGRTPSGNGAGANGDVAVLFGFAEKLQISSLFFFFACRGSVEFEIDQEADAGGDRQRDQNIYRRREVPREKTRDVLAVCPAQKGDNKETQGTPGRQRGEELPAGKLHDSGHRQERGEREWRRQQ